MFDDNCFETVTSLKYLGSTVNEYADEKEEIRRRIEHISLE